MKWVFQAIAKDRDWIPCIIYADIESLIKEIDRCVKKPKESSATKAGEQIPCVYSMLSISEFDRMEKKHTLSREENCMKAFY